MVNDGQLPITNYQLPITNRLRGDKVIKLVISITIPSRLQKPLLFLLLLHRRIHYGYAFRKIPLTQGKFAIVDPEDYERLNRYKWHICGGQRTYYAARVIKQGEGKKSRSVRMHREIIQVPDGMVIDHINRKGLDNRKANLRGATVSQNGWNSRKRKSKSKYRGVWWNKELKKWRVEIWFEGKREHIGYFDDEIAAAKAYDLAAKKYHEEFAVLNFEPKRKLTGLKLKIKRLRLAAEPLFRRHLGLH